ncbi:MAG TPA: response regulator [Burkholderiaceae bacterium]|nr:response regulator [Burkholderiaceae bacterium]
MDDDLWLAAPCAAIKLWNDDAGLHWRANAAALEWAKTSGLHEADWRHVTQQLRAAQRPATAASGMLAAPPVQWNSVALGGGWLLWLQPRDAQRAGAANEPTAAPAQPRLSVLYIEDNPVNVTLVKELVAMRPDVELACSVDGVSGVARAQADQPDVVLIDMQLPDIDGYEVLKRLRAEPRTARSTLVALSANAMSEDIAQAEAAGFDDYWTKPIDFRRFLARLDALIAAKAMAG